jgi:hypothetical protein
VTVIHHGTLRSRNDVELYAGEMTMEERPPRRAAVPVGDPEPAPASRPNLTFTVLGAVDVFTLISAGTMRLTLADGRWWPVSTPDGRHLKPS